MTCLEPWKTLSPVLSFKVVFGWLHLSKLLSKKNYKFKTNSKNTNTNCELSANLFFPSLSLSRSREKELRQKGTEVNLRVRDIIWVLQTASWRPDGKKRKPENDIACLPCLDFPRSPVCAWFPAFEAVYVNWILLSGRHAWRYTTHHLDNFHLSFDPKLVHEGLQVFLHLNTVVFELCFQLSQEKLRFKND